MAPWSQAWKLNMDLCLIQAEPSPASSPNSKLEWRRRSVSPVACWYGEADVRLVKERKDGWFVTGQLLGAEAQFLLEIP